MKSYNAFLDDFLSIVINTLEPEKIYDTMMTFLERLLDPAGLLLILNKEASRTYHVVRSFGSITCEKATSTPCDAIMNHLLTEDWLINIDESPELLSIMTPKKRQWIIEQKISAVVALKYQHAIIGFLFIVPKDSTPYTKDQLFFLQKICYYSSFVLRNANLYQNAYYASIMDDLTSLHNRKHALEYITDSCKKQLPKTLIFLDIDNFKLYNELYGITEADHLIRLCSQMILQELKPGDMGFRYGADEFFIVTDGCDTKAAADLARRIIQKITANNTADTVWNITITCGISAYPALSADAKSLIHDAVEAVYFGKLHGKGSLTVYHSGMESHPVSGDVHAAYDRVAPTIYALTAAIDAKDNFTFIHSMNVAKYAVILAEALDMNENAIEIVRVAALLHDIGKISIPEHILKKRTNLTPEEYEIMKTHVENSTKMIRYLPDMEYVIPVVLSHHERFDGKGYPRGLSGEDIPYLARILSIADCFDAMTARRSYKQPMSTAYAVSELKSNSGTQFDPALAEKFLELIQEGIVTV